MIQLKNLFFLLCLWQSIILQAQTLNTKIIQNTIWQEEEIIEGIVWKYKHFPFLFNGKQFINILEIDLSNPKYKIEFTYQNQGLMTTEEFAKEKKAILAINGSFFNIKKEKPVCFLKVDDKIISQTIVEDSIWYYNDACALGIDAKSNVDIRYKTDFEDWTHLSKENLMSTGPILVKNKEIQIWHEYDLANARTAVGIQKNKLIFLTVDGKNFQSKGLTINDLAVLMKSMGCENAINLDGGHSTTMWIRNKNIVNHPSKNKAFDHYGATKTANAILVIERD